MRQTVIVPNADVAVGDVVIENPKKGTGFRVDRIEHPRGCGGIHLYSGPNPRGCWDIAGSSEVVVK